MSWNFRIFSAILVSLFLQGNSILFASDKDSSLQPNPTQKTVNAAAALRALERGIGALASGDWQQAEFEASLGISYDPTLADFSYIEALSLAARSAPRADIIERLEYSLAPGLFWRTYTRLDSELLCARLYAETLRYSAALSRLGALKSGSSADADYVRILSLYGLGRIEEARVLVYDSLERWPFDSRFPRAFLQHEPNLKATDSSRKTADLILSRVYIWENEDRRLLLLAVPFESDPAIRERNIQIFRSMGTSDNEDSAAYATDPLSTIYALEYGIIDEKMAVDEIFSSEKSGISLSALTELCRRLGSAELRKSIASRLESFAGIIIDDANGDGINDTQILYRLGRPVQAVFDSDQDGYSDYSVGCDLGLPTTIALRSDKTVITYDTFPSVRSVTDGDREYTLKPLGLSWAPVVWRLQDLKLGGIKFYTIALTGNEPTLTERLLVNSSVFYTSTDPNRKGGSIRFALEDGVPVSSESRADGRVYEWTTYNRGFPALTRADRDGDGYFETTMTYTPKGILATVLVDRNGNRKNEYREEFLGNGSTKQEWDSDENGIFEISYTVTADNIEKTEWVHPGTGVLVVITVEKGLPRSIRYGDIQQPVIKDPLEQIWWIKGIPVNSREIVAKLNDIFNRDDSTVVSYSVTVNGKRIHAVRTGGLLFAESMSE